uniref:Uncharacterized protein n=1 Tax=Caenorhabditis japonica TaxID=281687 RepID=A0A8R1EVC5_CAEJA
MVGWVDTCNTYYTNTKGQETHKTTVCRIKVVEDLILQQQPILQSRSVLQAPDGVLRPRTTCGASYK